MNKARIKIIESIGGNARSDSDTAVFSFGYHNIFIDTKDIKTDDLKVKILSHIFSEAYNRGYNEVKGQLTKFIERI